MRRRRKEYLRRVPIKKAVGNRKRMNGYGRNNVSRKLLLGVPAALLAVGLIVLTVYVCRQLQDSAFEKEKLAQAYAKQQETEANHGNVGSGSKGNANMESDSNENNNSNGNNYSHENDNPNGNNYSHENDNFHGNNSPSEGSGSNGKAEGSGVSLVGTDKTPSPSPLPSPSPEPTTNGHEFDSEMVIAIDAGHGGYDGGSVVGSVIEKDVNLAVAQEIARLLEEHGGITVVQTRASDVHLSLQERCDIGNDAKCDYFVSVHCNTYEADSSVRGFECHYNEKSSEGAGFAQSVSNDMKQYKDMKIRSVKPNNLAVTVHTYCPAILIEMGFLTNATDCANLSDPDYQKQIAERITKAVLKAAGL